MKKLYVVLVLCLIITAGAFFSLLSITLQTVDYNNQLQLIVNEWEDKILIVQAGNKEFNLSYKQVTDIQPTDLSIKAFALSVPKVEYNIEVDLLELDAFLCDIYREPMNAFIYYQSGVGYQLVPSDDGLAFDKADVTPLFVDALVHEETCVDISNTLYGADICTDEVQETYNKLKWVNDIYVPLSTGEILTCDDFMEGSTLNAATLEFDTSTFNMDSIMSDYVRLYDTSDCTYIVVDANEEEHTVPYVTYGYTVDREATRERILNSLSPGIVTDVPIKPVIYGYDSDMRTRIEVSIRDQHVTHYVDGEICCETDCVTGTLQKHDTPIGVYYITECIPGKYLRGDGYTTWVNKWMRLTNSGIGLHDATWRSSFGSNIYTYNGSHGCINLPYGYAEQLYAEVYVGLPVVIY